MKLAAGEMMRAAVAVLLLMVLLAGIYPLATWGIGQILFPEKANGSLLLRENEIIGSVLIAQPFTSPAYFHARPSAVAYACSGAKSGGSNQGPLSALLHEQVSLRIKNYRRENGLAAARMVTTDAFSASASGLDPHISPADASAQATRVAKARGLSKNRVMQLIRSILEERQLGIFGEKRVNVLQLNLALDKQNQCHHHIEHGPGKSK